MPSLTIYLKSVLSNWFLHRNPRLRHYYMHYVRTPYMKAMTKWELRQWQAMQRRMHDAPEVEKLISLHLEEKRPFSAAKIGANELFLVQWMLGEKVLESRLHSLYDHAGVFPKNLNFYRQYGEVFIQALKNLDLLELWNGKGEPAVYRSLRMDADITSFPNVSTDFSKIAQADNQNWFSLLKGQRVLVISSFADLINQRSDQISWEKYWGGRIPWPQPASITAVPFPYGFDEATQKAYRDSIDLLTQFKITHQSALEQSDIVLAGCGAYAIPLLDWAKSSNKVAIHLGGHIQLLFGIKGRRWDSFPNLYNEHWVRPGSTLTPKTASVVEDSCYW